MLLSTMKITLNLIILFLNLNVWFWLQELLTRHKMLAADFLEANYEQVK